MEEIKYNVLIVDDDKFLLDMYALKFNNLGHHAVAVFGPNEALEKLRNGESPDALILDIIMPVMDGLELLEIIRKENLAPQSTVISLGSAGYIVKATMIPSEVVSEVIRILKENKK